MTWLISVLIAVGIILTLLFAITLGRGIGNGEKWAEITGLILVFGFVFVALVMSVHSVIF